MALGNTGGLEGEENGLAGVSGWWLHPLPLRRAFGVFLGWLAKAALLYGWDLGGGTTLLQGRVSSREGGCRRVPPALVPREGALAWL